MESIIIHDDYINETRDISATEIQNTHMMRRDDDLMEEIQEMVSTFEKRQPKAFALTNEIIKNYIMEAFDDSGKLFKENNSQTGTTINSVYGKLREIAYKNLLRVSKEFEPCVRKEAIMYFIVKVDHDLFEQVRQEAVEMYKQQIIDEKIPLPNEIKQFQKLISKHSIKQKLYQCIAEWYVEAEVSIDIVRRIYMYGIFEGTKEKKILDKLKRSWELKSNYYIGENF